MNTTKWIILVAVIAGAVLAYIFLPKVLFGIACVVAGAVGHNNWNVIVRNVKK